MLCCVPCVVLRRVISLAMLMMVLTHLQVDMHQCCPGLVYMSLVLVSLAVSSATFYYLGE